MKKKLLGLFMVLAAMFVTMTTVRAGEYVTADENVIDEQVYDHSHFEAGNNITSKSDVHGLSFVAGASVDVSGTKEYGFFAGESVKVNGSIEKDIFAAGNTVVIEKEATIGRDAYLAGNSVTINSNINGTVFIGASLVKLDNVIINGDLSIAANTVEILGDVTVNGTLRVNDNVVINNEQNLSALKTEKYKSTEVNIDFTNEISDIVLDILRTIFTALLLILAFPKLFKKIKYDLEAKDIGMKLLYGLLVLVAVPMICLVSLSIIVGMSVSVILLLMYIIAIMLSTILASVVIGQNIYTKLFKQKDNIYISMLIGILVVKIADFIPYIGGLFTFLVFLYGLGMIWRLFLDRNN